MSDRERLHRDDPVRTSPYRDWSTLFRSPGPGRDAGAAAGDGGRGPMGDWGDVVSRGVELGYRVIDEQIKQGQRVAEQLASQSYGPSAMGSDTQEIGERFMRSSADALRLWFELLTALFGRDLFGAMLPGGQRPDAGTARAAGRIAVEVASVRPARVTLDLQPGSAGRALLVHGLHAVDPTATPLTDVAFDMDPSAEMVGVRVRVPEGQAPGLYAGVVVDRETGEPRGTISVRVAE